MRAQLELPSKGNPSGYDRGVQLVKATRAAGGPEAVFTEVVSPGSVRRKHASWPAV